MGPDPNQEDEQNAAFCRDLCARQDPDRYFSTTLAPIEKRPFLLALYAFNQQISDVPFQVSEPTIGEIRLQWWRDEIDTIFAGETANHPVSSQLQACIQAYDLPQHLFKQLIDARQADLYKEQTASVAALLSDLQTRQGNLFDLAARILADEEALELKTQISDAAISYGLSQHAFDLARHIRHQHCTLPLDLLQKHDLDPAKILTASHSRSVDLVLAELGHQAQTHLQTLRADQHKLSKAVLPAFYPVCLAPLYFRKIARSDKNPLKHAIGPSQWRKQAKLFTSYFLEKI